MNPSFVASLETNFTMIPTLFVLKSAISKKNYQSKS